MHLDSPRPLIGGDLTRLRHFPESARSSPSLATRLRLAEIQMLKAVLVNVDQSCAQVLTRELPPETFVKEVIPFPRIKSPDIFRVTLCMNCSMSRFLQTAGFTQLAVECIKPLVLVAQGPQVVDIDGISHGPALRPGCPRAARSHQQRNVEKPHICVKAMSVMGRSANGSGAST